MLGQVKARRYSHVDLFQTRRMTKTYGDKPLVFAFEPNGEQYMIGSEVAPIPAFVLILCFK